MQLLPDGPSIDNRTPCDTVEIMEPHLAVRPQRTRKPTWLEKAVRFYSSWKTERQIRRLTTPKPEKLVTEELVIEVARGFVPAHNCSEAVTEGTGDLQSEISGQIFMDTENRHFFAHRLRRS